VFFAAEHGWRILRLPTYALDVSDDVAVRLLAYLQREIGPNVAFAEAPVPLSGGYNNTILAFRLRAAPEPYSGPLVLRLMRPADGALLERELITHEAMVDGGFPAPRVLMSSGGSEHALGAPFMIMERLKGVNMVESIIGKGGRLTRFFAMTPTLAAVHRQIHAVDPQPFLEAYEASKLDLEEVTAPYVVRAIAERVVRDNAVGLMPAAKWLVANLPQPETPPVICHGDFHPLNVIVDGDDVTGVVDWTLARLGDPAYDVGATVVLLLFGPVDVPGPLRGLVQRLRTFPARRYIRAYRSGNETNLRNLHYYECVRMLSIIAHASDMDQWNDSRTLSALARRFKKHSGVEVRL
jgi:aminoglycoside phosphotransferase (APT) family kinase protein